MLSDRKGARVFIGALDYYLAEGFTLIELGDAEELWEVKRFDQIYITHTSIYERLAAFHDSDPQKTRYIKIWGNHDRIRRRERLDIDIMKTIGLVCQL